MMARLSQLIQRGRAESRPYVLWMALVLAGCGSGTVTPTRVDATPIDFGIPATADGTLTATAVAVATSEGTATSTAAPTIVPTQDYRTRPVAGIVTPASPLVPVDATLGVMNGIPSNVRAWDRYVLRYIDLSIPVPPGWIIREWPLPDEMPIYYSVSVIPDVYENSQAVLLPEITLTVYRAPLGESLDAWFAEHSMAAAFDRNNPDPNVFFYEVTRGRAVRVGDVPALRFTRELLGTDAVTVIVANGETVATITAAVYSMTDLQRVYEVMLTGIESTRD
jgi:hypothetical protein